MLLCLLYFIYPYAFILTAVWVFYKNPVFAALTTVDDNLKDMPSIQTFPSFWSVGVLVTCFSASHRIDTFADAYSANFCITLHRYFYWYL